MFFSLLPHAFSCIPVNLIFFPVQRSNHLVFRDFAPGEVCAAVPLTPHHATHPSLTHITPTPFLPVVIHPTFSLHAVGAVLMHSFLLQLRKFPVLIWHWLPRPGYGFVHILLPSLIDLCLSLPKVPPTGTFYGTSNCTCSSRLFPCPSPLASC